MRLVHKTIIVLAFSLSFTLAQGAGADSRHCYQLSMADGMAVTRLAEKKITERVTVAEEKIKKMTLISEKFDCLRQLEMDLERFVDSGVEDCTTESLRDEAVLFAAELHELFKIAQSSSILRCDRYAKNPGYELLGTEQLPSPPTRPRLAAIRIIKEVCTIKKR